jgi:hypothetical protein
MYASGPGQHGGLTRFERLEAEDQLRPYLWPEQERPAREQVDAYSGYIPEYDPENPNLVSAFPPWFTALLTPEAFMQAWDAPVVNEASFPRNMADEEGRAGYYPFPAPQINLAGGPGAPGAQEPDQWIPGASRWQAGAMHEFLHYAGHDYGHNSLLSPFQEGNPEGFREAVSPEQREQIQRYYGEGYGPKEQYPMAMDLSQGSPALLPPNLQPFYQDIFQQPAFDVEWLTPVGRQRLAAFSPGPGGLWEPQRGEEYNGLTWSGEEWIITNLDAAVAAYERATGAPAQYRREARATGAP